METVASEWPAATVALALIGLVAVVSVAAIRKYPAEAALKIIGAMSGVTGVIVGSVGTYFFGVAPSKQEARKYQLKYAVAQQELRSKDVDLPPDPVVALRDPIIDWAAAGNNQEKLGAWLMNRDVRETPAKWLADARPEELEVAIRALGVRKSE